MYTFVIFDQILNITNLKTFEIETKETSNCFGFIEGRVEARVRT